LLCGSPRRVLTGPQSNSLSDAEKSAAAADPSCRSKKPAAGDAPPRAALHDITNDSPIVGLAAGGLGTPQASTAGAKNRARPRCTPGSGEALLRGQVKTLLQKVDEEGAAAIQPLRIHALLGVTRSPAQLLAPTPANTPQLWAGPAASLLLPDGLAVMPCVLEEEELIPKLQVPISVLSRCNCSKNNWFQSLVTSAILINCSVCASNSFRLINLLDC
jgi:hypothetical protein